MGTDPGRTDGRSLPCLLEFGADEPLKHLYDILEGTEQIQQLVISRALSGMRIE